MFTGIIEEIGTIRSLCIQGSSGTIAIHAQKVLEGTMVGDSIAVNGICLTVTSIHPWGCISQRRKRRLGNAECLSQAATTGSGKRVYHHRRDQPDRGCCDTV